VKTQAQSDVIINPRETLCSEVCVFSCVSCSLRQDRHRVHLVWNFRGHCDCLGYDTAYYQVRSGRSRRRRLCRGSRRYSAVQR
jgi:hypothetical protein